MMFLTSSILLGFVRLGFIILFLFYLNRKFISTTNKMNFLDFIISNWFRFGSIILVLIFILVEVNAYNLFNTYFFLLLIVIIDIIGLKNLRNLRNYFNTHIKNGLLSFLRNVESNRSFWYWFSFPKNNRHNKKSYTNIIILILTIVIATITFLSRYYFIIYDNYSLSDAWIYDLNKIIQFDNNYWFTYELASDGELAMVNLYGKITDVSPEIALQVIAILESTLLSVSIFWTINKLTPSKFIAPIIASLSFGLVYVLTPLNVYFLLKGNPIFLAFTFALPAFVYFLRPNLLKLSRLSYTFSYIFVFIGIGLIDIFSYFILLPPFLIIGLIVTKYKNKISNLLVLLSFTISTGILITIYGFACYNQGANLMEFIHQNLLSVNYYTYIPQLIIPYSIIIEYVQYSTYIGFGLIFILMIFKKENWRSTIVFFLYFNFIIMLTYIKNKWIDIDMLNNSISVLLPIILGLNAAIVIRIFNLVLYRVEKIYPVTITVLIIGMVYAAIFYQEKVINSLTKADNAPKQILNAYDKIKQSFFEQSYCVVNDPAAQVISTNNHFFMNYDFFINEYAKTDYLYFKNRKDPKFLIKNPQYSLSKSVLVFILNDKNKDENNVFSENKKLNAALNSQLGYLRKRGRKINLFYDTEFLKVYEIVNEPRESKVSDLIF